MPGALKDVQKAVTRHPIIHVIIITWSSRCLKRLTNRRWQISNNQVYEVQEIPESEDLKFTKEKADKTM
jgi:hypothetical protein